MFKRILAAALTCTMVLSLSACGGSQQGQQSTSTSEPSQAEQVSTAEPSEATPESSASQEPVSTDSGSEEESARPAPAKPASGSRRSYCKRTAVLWW